MAKKDDDLNLSQKLGLSVFTRVADFFSLQWDSVWDSLEKKFDTFIEKIVARFRKLFLGQITDDLKASVKANFDKADIDPAIRSLFDKELEGTDLFDVFQAFVKVWGMVFGGFSTLGQISLQPTYQRFLTDTRNTLPDVASLLSARLRRGADTSRIDELLAKYGYSGEAQSILRLAARPNLPFGSLPDLLHREAITPEEVDDTLKHYGYDETQRAQLTQLFTFLPSVQDLIRFSVREVYDDAITQRFGQYEEYPERLTKEGAKVGAKEEILKQFWAAHWVLPSMNQGYEMLHRGVITDDDLAKLMVAQDIMPFWRKPLQAISYNPYTRVDVRRMYEAGVLDYEQMITAYKDVGYDETKAKTMADFSVINSLEKERELTRSDITSAYKRRLMDYSEALESLTMLGYNEINSEFLLARIDFDSAKKEKEMELKVIKNKFMSGIISESDLNSSLTVLALPAAEINSYVALWSMEKDAEPKPLALKELKDMFKGEIITKEEFTNELTNIGYSPKHVGWLVKLVSPEA